MMLTVNKLPDMDHFLSMVDRCQGSVMLHLPNGELCDLKHSSTGRQLLSMMKQPSHPLSLSFSCVQDSSQFLQYLTQAAYKN